MQKRYVVNLWVALGCVTALPAQATEKPGKWYASGNTSGGYQFDVQQPEYATAQGYSGKIGLIPASEGKFGHTRVEGEYLHNGKNLIEDLGAKTEVDAGMLNGYYDFDTKTPLVPYVGVGVGYADVSHKIPGAKNDSDGGAAIQVLTGFSYADKEPDRLKVYLSYRVLGIPSAMDTRQAESEKKRDYYITQSMEVGAQYRF